MKIHPLGDKVVLKPVTAEAVTKSGIVLPDTASKEKPEQGEVVATGPGKMLEDGTRAEMTLKKGDRVLFAKYSPTEIKMEGKDYLIVSADDILATLS